MIRVFLTVFFAFSLLCCCAQDTINQTDSKGKKQGFWQKQDSIGHKVYEGRFKDGLPMGEFRYYYPDGKLKTVSQVSRSGKIAMTVSYFANGKKMAAGRYLNEKKDSTWQFFSEEDGGMVAEENYKRGMRSGVSQYYRNDGKVSEVITWIAGVRYGPWEQYYSDGKIRLRGAYLNDEKNGPFNTFYNSGQPMMSGAYVAGHMDGNWIYYDEKGKVTKKEYYSKGALVKNEK
jgi:antitoxin component YwqK of YwqJK toxin-antitoxin module